MKVTTLPDIELAQTRIQSDIFNTPLRESDSFSQLAGSQIYVKFENMQRTGSFKIRGALNKIRSLPNAERVRGVVASSAGNHAQGVALGAHLVGTHAHIVMPEAAPLVKIEGAKKYGAEVILHGSYYDEAYLHAQDLAQEKGYVFVHPFEDPEVIAGQGTIALEILQEIPDIDTIVVPMGGGGLISGVAVAIKARRPQCQIFGVQSAAAPGMAQSFINRRIVEVPHAGPTIADGLAVKKPSAYIFDHYIHPYLDGVATVSDEEIAESIVHLLERTKTLCEGAGAVALAAVLHQRMPLGKKTCVVISGGNIDLNLISRVVESGLVRAGRIARVSVIIGDIPGNLSRLTQVIATSRGNILEVHHDRVSRGLYLRETRVDFVVETVSEDHARQIRAALTSCGARLID